MPENQTLGTSVEHEHLSGRLFFSPTVRAKNEDSKARAEELAKTMTGSRVFLESEDLVGFEELVGNGDFVTLQDFFQMAEEATKQGDRAKLVALKRLGQALLEKKGMPSTGKENRADQAWDWDFETKSEDKTTIRAAEMIILKAEMEYLKMRQQQGTFETIPEDRREALQSQFRHYGHNTDIPEEFRRQLHQASVGWKPLRRVLSDSAKTSETTSESSVIEEDLADSTSETLAIKGAAEETKINLPELGGSTREVEAPEVVPQKRRRYGDLNKEERRRLKAPISALRKLELYEDGIPLEFWNKVEPYLPEAVELSVMKGSLPDRYWIQAQIALQNALQRLGILDDNSALFVRQLAQQLQYALHSNRHENRSVSWKSWFGYWLSWGGVDWLSHLMTRAEVLGRGGKSLIHPGDVLGEKAVKALIKIRGQVAEASRKAAEALASSLEPTDQVVKTLLELVAEEFEAVSRFEAEALSKRNTRKVKKKKK